LKTIFVFLLVPCYFRSSE